MGNISALQMSRYNYCCLKIFSSQQVGVIGNFAITVSLTIMSKRQSHASNNTSLFLASLSMADLLFLLLYVPLDLWRQVDTRVYQTAPVCKMISYVEMLTALASVINLSAVSMER